MVYFLDEPGHQKLRNLLADHPAFLRIKATQALLHRLGAWSDLQGVLSDFSRNAWHVRRFPRKDVSVGAEDADECAILFGGERGTNAYHFTLRAAGVYEDLLDALHGLKRSNRPLGVGCFLSGPLLDDHELLRGDNHRGMLTTLNFALISTLEGGADGDDPTRA